MCRRLHAPLPRLYSPLVSALDVLLLCALIRSRLRYERVEPWITLTQEHTTFDYAQMLIQSQLESYPNVLLLCAQMFSGAFVACPDIVFGLVDVR